jgi:tetratricopeptide (TPR) repeat protein
LDDDQRAEFGELLELIRKQNPDDIPVKQLYADYLIAAEKFSQAVPVLEDLFRIQPMRGLQAAALLRNLGNDAAADRMAKRTLESVAKLSEEDPTNSRLALAVAQNQLFIKRYSEAVRTLDRAIRRAKTDQERDQLNQAIGDAMVAWVSSLEESPNKSVSDRLRILKMLQVALEHAPNNPRVLTVVADQVLATMNEDDNQVRAVRAALIQGSSAGIAHFIRGTAALMKDDLDSATTSLQLAAEHMPHSGAILNNLAVALSVRDDSDLEQALKISESAIKQTKNPTPHFFETRGQILYRLGRYIDAIPDLERALAVEQLAVGAHEVLADCYAEIGEQELSRLHREAAGDLAGESTSEEVADSSQ